LLVKGWVRAEWKASELGRRARVYTLTPAGRKRLAQEAGEFTRMAGAIIAILHGA
jgi:DNA-binding PadR family transcriptional regulator